MEETKTDEMRAIFLSCGDGRYVKAIVLVPVESLFFVQLYIYAVIDLRVAACKNRESHFTDHLVKFLIFCLKITFDELFFKGARKGF